MWVNFFAECPARYCLLLHSLFFFLFFFSYQQQQTIKIVLVFPYTGMEMVGISKLQNLLKDLKLDGFRDGI